MLRLGALQNVPGRVRQESAFRMVDNQSQSGPGPSLQLTFELSAFNKAASVWRRSEVALSYALAGGAGRTRYLRVAPAL